LPLVQLALQALGVHAQLGALGGGPVRVGGAQLGAVQLVLKDGHVVHVALRAGAGQVGQRGISGSWGPCSFLG
jgi:hypothetical protein